MIKSKIKEYFKSSVLQKADGILLIAFVMLLAACYYLQQPLMECLNTKSEISQGYQMKKGSDGTLYVIDAGHDRVIRFDENGRLIYALSGITVGDSGYLYIEDFATDEEQNLYLIATEWQGMQVSREFLLKYTKAGKLDKVIVENDYSEISANKRKIFGITAKDGMITYAQCEQEHIDIYKGSIDGEVQPQIQYTIPYEDAYDAVGDLVIGSDTMWILDKDGTVLENGLAGIRVIYSVTSAESEREHVPYRIGVTEGGELYFTDIKGCSIQRVNKETRTSETVIENTESITVSVEEEGNDAVFYLVGSHSANIVAGDIELSYEILNKNIMNIVMQILYLVLLGILLVTTLIVLVRGISFLNGQAISSLAKTCFGVAIVVLMMVSVIVSIMLQEVREQYKGKMCEQIEMAAYVVANQLSAKDISNIKLAKDFHTKSYEQISTVMERSFSTEVEFNRQMYCNILVMGEEEAYAVAYLDHSIGTYFPLDEYETEEVRTVYETGEPVWNDGKLDVSGTYLYVKVPVYDDAGKVAGVVAVGTTTELIDMALAELQKEIFSATIVIVLLLCLAFSEGIMFMTARNKFQQRKQKDADTVAFPGHVIRALVFTIFLAYNLSSSFLSVFVMRNSIDIGIISKELAASLPMTINIFVMGIMSLSAAKFVRKLGISKLSLLSGACSFTGNLIIFLFGNYQAIFIGLLLDGIGVGLLTNAAYILITYIKDEESRTEGFTIYNGACLSGINFGMMLGSILAVNLTHRVIFLCGAALWSVVIVLLVQIGKITDGMISEEEAEEIEEAEKVDIRKFLGKRRVWSFMTLIQNPYIIFNGFVFYYVPLFCDSIGEAEVTTSLLLILYSELAVLFGEFLTKKTTEVFGYKAMYLAYGMNIVAVVAFAWLGGMEGMVLALIILGLSASFGKTVQQSYFMELDETKELGEDRAAGIYNFTENIGESLGPVIFGRMMAQSPLNLVVTAFGSMISAIGLTHFVLNKEKRRYS